MELTSDVPQLSLPPKQFLAEWNIFEQVHFPYFPYASNPPYKVVQVVAVHADEGNSFLKSEEDRLDFNRTWVGEYEPKTSLLLYCSKTATPEQRELERYQEARRSKDKETDLFIQGLKVLFKDAKRGSLDKYWLSLINGEAKERAGGPAHCCRWNESPCPKHTP